MPSKTTTPFASVYREISDRDASLDEEGTNKLGLRSHSVKPNKGKWGYAEEGLRCFGMACKMRDFFYGNEGRHMTYPVFVFKDIGPGPGATITDALLTLPLDFSALVNSTYNPNGLGTGLRVFAVKEPNYCPRQIDLPTGYDSQEKNEHWHQFGYPRMYRVSSYESHKQHTDACAYYWVHPSDGYAPFTIPAPNPTGSTFVQVLQEVVSQSGWLASNRMCLCVVSDKNGIGEGNHTTHPSQVQPVGAPGADLMYLGAPGSALSVGDVSVNFRNPAMQPTLAITWS